MSSLWPILVLSVTDIYPDIIIEIQALCLIYTENSSETEMGKIPVRFPGTAFGIIWIYYLEIMETDSEMFAPVMAKCTNFNIRNISRSIISHLSNYKARNAIVLFLKSNDHGDNELHGSY